MIKKLLNSTFRKFQTFGKFILPIVLFFAMGLCEVNAQTGSIKGRILDKKNGEPVAFANVVAEAHGRTVGGTVTDFDGYYTIKPLDPGSYDVKATFVGYNTSVTTGVVVSPDKITFLDLKLGSSIQELDVIEVIGYKTPLIEKDGGTHTTISHEDIAKMPGRSAASVAQTVGGVYSKDDGSGDMNVRGSRDEATDIYIDGVKVRGSSGVPASAIDQVTVITGGLPPQYGDATGGIISITTRGPSPEFSGGIEYLTSGFHTKKDKNFGLDAFGYNLLGFNLSGPLIKTRNEFDTTKFDPLVGFFLAGELVSVYDGDPSAIGVWKATDKWLDSLEKYPISATGSGTGSNQTAEFTRMDDLINVKARPNAREKGIDLSAKIDVRTGPNINLSFGGSMDFNTNRDVYTGKQYSDYVFNYMNKGEVINRTMRGWVKFAQKFASDTARKANVIKNAYYSVQLDYQKFWQTTQNVTHKKNFFDYGYIGKFTTYSEKSYIWSNDTVTGWDGWIHNGFRDTLYAFEASDKNPVMTNYTQRYYDLYANNPVGNYQSFDQVQTGGGLLNGIDPYDSRSGVYNIWSAPGTPFNNYSFRNNGQFRLNASGSADIGNHAFSAGFEYEQREDRNYTVRPGGLWEQMRQLVNSHISQLDLANPYAVFYTSDNQRIVIKKPGDYSFFSDTTYADTIYYGRFYDGASQSYVDYNLRHKLNYDTKGTDWIDVNAQSPETFNLNFFSPDELLANGNGAGGVSYTDYYGYDPYGKKLKADPSLDDFFNKTIEDPGYPGPKLYERPIGPYRPIYLAGYIQDKFAFKDLIFNIGLRIDRFDANQPVLKDPYLWFPAVTAGELRNGKDRAKLEVTVPENIGDNYVVYVDNVQKPGNVAGYREGSTWYNNSGSEINDPSDIIAAGSGGITPYLVDPSRTKGTDLNTDGFTDYVPQVTYLPRIAFSFPISDEALFFAHYDVLSERPSSPYADPIERLSITDYYFVQNISATLNNPALKPSKTIDYELGFQQKLTNNSSLKFSSFYREMRDYLQITSVVGAYPKQYETWANFDFGTVKGFNIGYDLRRFGNARMRANYALQFAEGTGSSIDQQKNLIRAGLPNLKIISPFGYDQRHAINLSFDYRYAGGADYDGPVIKDMQVLANAGVNLLFNAGSGTPYSKQVSAYRTSTIVAQNGNLVGSINGSRLPWQFRIDARLDKDFELKFGGKKQEGDGSTEGEGEAPPQKAAKTISMNVYLQVLNVLNTVNIVSVYGFTGNPDDDGYLTANDFQSAINSTLDSQAYRDLYTIKMNNPDHYSLPRRMRLGVMLNF